MTAGLPVSTRTNGEPTRSGGGTIDTSFRIVALGAGLSVLAILALIAYFTTKQAWPIFSKEGLGFVTGSTWDPTHSKYGALPFIYGTAVSSAIALLIAVPLSIGIALFTNELAPRRLRKPVIYIVDLLAAIPSVVYGLWALAVLDATRQHLLQAHLRHGRQAAPSSVMCSAAPPAA